MVVGMLCKSDKPSIIIIIIMIEVLDEMLQYTCPGIGVKIGTKCIHGKYYIDDLSIMMSIFFREYIPVQEYLIIIEKKWGNTKFRDWGKRWSGYSRKGMGKLLGGWLAFLAVTLKLP